MLFLLELCIDEIINGVPAWTEKEKKNEDDKIDQCKFAFRHHGIMNIEKCNSHRNDHRNCHNSDKEPGDKKKRTDEFAEDSDHQGHIAAKAQDTRIIGDKSTEIHHLVKSMNEEKYAENNTYNQNEEGNTLPFE